MNPVENVIDEFTTTSQLVGQEIVWKQVCCT